MVRRVASAYLLSEPTIFLGKCLYQVRNVLFFSCSVDWKLRWLSFLSVLSVFVDFPFWMRLGVRYHCYYLYLVVCQHIWRNVLPLFFPRYTGVKKTQHYKLFISNPIVLFWRIKKKNGFFFKMKRDQREKRYFYKIPFLKFLMLIFDRICIHPPRKDWGI